MSLYQTRIIERAPNEFYAQVRKTWWLPWLWADVGSRGDLVESCDNGRELTYEMADRRIDRFFEMQSFPRQAVRPNP